MTQREKAEELRRLHAAPEPLVLVNAWDAVSARVVADAGARAIATASWSIAAARGYEDGEQIPLDEMLDSVRVVARAVELPVTADLERGFGDAGADRRARDRGRRGGLQPGGLRRAAAGWSRSRRTSPPSPPPGPPARPPACRW